MSHHQGHTHRPSVKAHMRHSDIRKSHANQSASSHLANASVIVTGGTSLSSTEPPDYSAMSESRQEIRESLDTSDLPQQSKNRRNRSNLKILSVFPVALLLSAGFIAEWIFGTIKVGEPPSENAAESYQNAILSYSFLALTSVIGLIILCAKIGNMVFGILYMFLLVVVLYYGSFGLTRSIYSIDRDGLATTMIPYLQQYYETKKIIPEFYHKLQQEYQCCGFKNMDHLGNWPELLNSTDLPRSCCVKSKNPKYFKQCEGLARMNAPGIKRVPSGYLIQMQEEIKDKWFRESENNTRKGFHPTPEKVPGHYENEVNDWVAVLEPGKGTVQPYDESYNDLIFKEAQAYIGKEATLVGSQMLNRLDRLTEQMLYYGALEKYKEGDWIAWLIPTFPTENKTRFASNTNRTDDYFSLYYISRGVAENIMMRKVLHDRRCELGVNEALKKKKKPRKHINKVFVEDKNNKDGKFFESVLKSRMMWTCAWCSITIFVTIILTMIFWYYYSNIKAQEISNIEQPGDFDLINVNFDTYAEPEDIKDFYSETDVEDESTHVHRGHDRHHAENSHGSHNNRQLTHQSHNSGRRLSHQHHNYGPRRSHESQAFGHGHGHDPLGHGHDPLGHGHDPRGHYGHDPRGHGHDPRGHGHDPRGHGHDPRGHGHDLRGHGHVDSSHHFGQNHAQRSPR